MIPRWLVIVGLVLMAGVVLMWALSHIVWVLIGGVLGYLVREAVEHYVNR